ncbi:MAG: prepilin-type N-terminal cleavage/methylation domain-containing protein [Psychrobacter sp.]|nr:prepilin-type N-terminal cleavage/methylation domain-containing protein [Psychrobacter sp.]
MLIKNDHAITGLPKLKQQRAFTLIELIITIAIMAIIVTIATPYVLTQMAAMEAKRIRYDISNTLYIAKAESLIHRQNLIVCLSDDNSTCNKNSNLALLLFVDNNDNNFFDSDVDLLLNAQRLDPKYATLHLRASAGRHHIKFFGDTGTPRGHFGHIKYCPNTSYNTTKYQVSFNNIGIIRHKPNSSHPTDCD